MKTVRLILKLCAPHVGKFDLNDKSEVNSMCLNFCGEYSPQVRSNLPNDRSTIWCRYCRILFIFPREDVPRQRILVRSKWLRNGLTSFKSLSKACSAGRSRTVIHWISYISWYVGSDFFFLLALLYLSDLTKLLFLFFCLVSGQCRNRLVLLVTSFSR
jgi:hypothetical protein